VGEPVPVDPRNLRPGPIRHESLPPELLERAGAVHAVLGPYLGTTLEQFEINLMRDADPGSEVAVWCSIAAAWLAYHERHTGDQPLPDAQEKPLIAALIAISTGVEAADRLGVPPEVGRRLLACYDGVAGE